mgnify:FL=1
MTIREFVEKCSIVTDIGITKCGDEDAVYPYKVEDFDAIGFNRQILNGRCGKYVRDNGILDKEVYAFRDTMDLRDPFQGIIVIYK